MSDVGDEEFRMKAFRRMNVKISSNLTESNLETLKYLFETEGIPVSDLEEANSGVRLFKLLEQRGVYTPHKVSVVKDALETFGREDLRKHILEFESVKVWDEEHDGQGRLRPTNPPDYQPHIAQENPIEMLTENFLKDLSKEVGLQWKMLARELEVPEKEIDGIAHGFPNQLHEQSYQALLKWKQMGAEQNATALHLKRALKKQKLNAIVYKYFGKAQ